MQFDDRHLFEHYARPLFKPGSKVLEIGPDECPSLYRRIAGETASAWETLDMRPSGRLTYTSASEYCFPIASDQFDVVLSGQDFAHVRKAWFWIKEMARVCKPGGTVLITAPMTRGYIGEPVDCRTTYREGVKALFEDAGLEMTLSEFAAPELYGYQTDRFPRRANDVYPREAAHAGRNLETISVGTKKCLCGEASISSEYETSVARTVLFHGNSPATPPA